MGGHFTFTSYVMFLCLISCPICDAELKEFIHLKQSSGSAYFEEDSPNSGFLNHGTVDILRKIIL